LHAPEQRSRPADFGGASNLAAEQDEAQKTDSCVRISGHRGRHFRLIVDGISA
jgi:hypothetical protein